jgi:hypothetical protein
MIHTCPKIYHATLAAQATGHARLARERTCLEDRLTPMLEVMPLPRLRRVAEGEITLDDGPAAATAKHIYDTRIRAAQLRRNVFMILLAAALPVILTAVLG